MRMATFTALPLMEVRTTTTVRCSSYRNLSTNGWKLSSTASPEDRMDPLQGEASPSAMDCCTGPLPKGVTVLVLYIKSNPRRVHRSGKSLARWPGPIALVWTHEGAPCKLCLGGPTKRRGACVLV